MLSWLPEEINADSLCQIGTQLFQDSWKPLVINFLANLWDVLREFPGLVLLGSIGASEIKLP